MKEEKPAPKQTERRQVYESRGDTRKDSKRKTFVIPALAAMGQFEDVTGFSF